MVLLAADYYPYGKILREFNPQAEKYLTTHHERDTETGLDYRGARYYDSDIARFLSLDQKAADYPSLSSYNYVAGNPLIFIDPDGREIVDAMQNKVTVNVTKNSDGTYNATYKFAEGTVQSIKDNFMTNGARVINTLIQIESGRELVKAADEHQDKINVAVSPDEHKGKNGQPSLGSTGQLINVNGEVVGSQVVIYEGEINKLTDASTQAQEYKLNNLTQDQKVARTGAHELKHATTTLDIKANADKRDLTTEEHQTAINVGKVVAIEFGELNNKTNPIDIKPEN